MLKRVIRIGDGYFSYKHIWRLEDLCRRDDFINIAEMTTAIKPASPDKGGVEVYFSGIPARIIQKQGIDRSFLEKLS